MTVKEYIAAHEEEFLQDLFALLRIPSISSQSEHKPDMVHTAEHWRDYLLASKFIPPPVIPLFLPSAL